MEVLAAIAKGVKDIPYAPTQVSGLLKGLFVFMGAPGVGKGTFATILGPALVSQTGEGGGHSLWGSQWS